MRPIGRSVFDVDGIASTVKQALRHREFLVHSDAQQLDGRKIAAAADTIEQLCSLIEDLRGAQKESARVVEALTGAVKLAQHGALDVSDIIASAQTMLKTGKLQAAGEIFDAHVGVLAPPRR